ncbi:MAG: protein translocase SecG subunit [Crocinitomicaceae bacterium]|jgi:protein translocase SecG subunit
MNSLITILPTLQIILSVLLIISILLQKSEESLGGAFGGSDSVDTTKTTRRGSEKILFQSAIVLAILFTLVSIIVVISK